MHCLICDLIKQCGMLQQHCASRDCSLNFFSFLQQNVTVNFATTFCPLKWLEMHNSPALRWINDDTCQMVEQFNVFSPVNDVWIITRGSIQWSTQMELNGLDFKVLLVASFKVKLYIYGLLLTFQVKILQKIQWLWESETQNLH